MGLEPTRLSTSEPKSDAAASYANPPYDDRLSLFAVSKHYLAVWAGGF